MMILSFVNQLTMTLALSSKFQFWNTSLMLASCLLLHCLQIKLIEDDLKQLTKLEIKRRNLDTENLQVGVPTLLLFLPLYTFFLLLSLKKLLCHISMTTYPK